jgi:hypothetical protein
MSSVNLRGGGLIRRRNRTRRIGRLYRRRSQPMSAREAYARRFTFRHLITGIFWHLIH